MKITRKTIRKLILEALGAPDSSDDQKLKTLIYSGREGSLSNIVQAQSLLHMSGEADDTKFKSLVTDVIVDMTKNKLAENIREIVDVELRHKMIEPLVDAFLVSVSDLIQVELGLNKEAGDTVVHGGIFEDFMYDILRTSEISLTTNIMETMKNSIGNIIAYQFAEFLSLKIKSMNR